MATGLAHELKQPLAIIALAAENAAQALGRGKPGRSRPRLGRIVAPGERGRGR